MSLLIKIYTICPLVFEFSIRYSLALTFLSSPLAGKRDIVVTILVWYMCMRPCGFVQTILCTIMHGFHNNLAQLLPLRRKSAI